jgi:hypothetical protein
MWPLLRFFVSRSIAVKRLGSQHLGLALARASGEPIQIAWAIWARGYVAMAQENYVLARACFEQSLILLRAWE